MSRHSKAQARLGTEEYKTGAAPRRCADPRPTHYSTGPIGHMKTRRHRALLRVARHTNPQALLGQGE